MTSANSTASLGDLNQIVNLDDESVCIRFQAASGENKDRKLYYGVVAADGSIHYGVASHQDIYISVYIYDI